MIRMAPTAPGLPDPETHDEVKGEGVGGDLYGFLMVRIGVFEFTAAVWLHPGAEGWHFVTVPPDVSDDISGLTAGVRRGFGSVRVAVTVGRTTWRTSVFPDAKAGTYLLPMKKEVRRAENLTAGDDVHARLELVDL
jgi:hypothetical protein